MNFSLHSSARVVKNINITAMKMVLVNIMKNVMFKVKKSMCKRMVDNFFYFIAVIDVFVTTHRESTLDDKIYVLNRYLVLKKLQISFSMHIHNSYDKLRIQSISP